MIVIFVVLLLGVVLRFFQESCAENAAEKLNAMLNTNTTVVPDGKDAEVPLKLLVPGNIVRLSAGDIIPADVPMLTEKRHKAPTFRCRDTPHLRWVQV